MFRWLVRTAVAGASLLLAQETPVIRVDVDLVHVVATVRNYAGELVGTLGKDDFEIFDNGVRQEIRIFNRQSEQPLSIALLLDTSGSTSKEMRYETDSASRFLRALLAEGHPGDAVSFYTFSYDVTLQHDFTRDYAVLERRLKSLVVGQGGSSVYDAVSYAARALEPREGRKVIILVSDGGDTTSSGDLKSSVKAAQLADAVIYPVVVMPITNEAGRNIGGENHMTLMALWTGGRTFQPATGVQLDRAFADIILELRTQYQLGFYPRGVPPSANPFHTLEVKVKSPELRVSARNGYYGVAEDNAGAGGGRISVTPERKRKNQQEN